MGPDCTLRGVTDDSLPALRASDADREHTADLLRHAMGEGRLTMEELDERLDLAYAARTQAELDTLTRDVVVAGTPRASGRGCPSRAAPAGPSGSSRS